MQNLEKEEKRPSDIIGLVKPAHSSRHTFGFIPLLLADYFICFFQKLLKAFLLQVSPA